MTRAAGPAAPTRRGRSALLAALVTGLLLAAAFPSLDWGPLALVALVPLFVVWHDAGPGRAALTGFVAGIAFFGWLLSWTWYFGAVAIVPLVLAEAAYWAGAGALVGLLGRWRLRSPWLTAAVWVVLEALRTRWPLGGLGWGEVGAAFHDFPVARGLASWGGVPLVSFLAVATNALLADAWITWRARARTGALAAGGARREGDVGEGSGRTRAARAAWRRTAAGIALVIAVAAVGDWTRYTPRPLAPIRFALLQGNDQDRRLTQAEIDAGYLTNRHFALAQRLRGRYDVIVFPESSFETDPETDPALHRRVAALARRHHSAVLVNVVEQGTDGREYNTNRLYDAQGLLVGSYRKQHLVPFGEYVPWRDQLSFISELQQIPHDFTRGTHDEVLPIDTTRLASMICFESAFAPLVRSFVREGAEVIVVSTNNRSYRRSANAAQHLALSQMRAAETARPVLHASISGITGVIDSSGDVLRTTHLFRNAIVSGTIRPTTGESPSVRYGEWVAQASILAVAAALLWGGLRRRLRP